MKAVHLPPAWRLHLQLLQGAFRDQPLKWLITTLAIALGVGLGFAVHLIHKQALAQFDSGVRQFSGQADLQWQPHSQWLPEEALETIALRPEVLSASPVIDIQVRIAGLDEPVRWLGIDLFTAALVTPNLIGQTDDDFLAQRGEIPALQSDTVFASPALLEALSKRGQAGEAATSLEVMFNGEPSNWALRGSVPAAGSASMVLVSDIASAQWQFGLLEKLSRIDIKLKDGVLLEPFRNSFEAIAQTHGRLETPSEQSTRGASASQAYRANLSILAMVALLTGGFLSFSTQLLSVAHRSRQWALLAALGMKGRYLRRQIYLEAGASGLVGGILGLVLGLGLASWVVGRFGVDLGAGYFSTSANSFEFSVLELLVFLGFGLSATLLGGLAPARHAEQGSTQQRMRAGSEESGLQFANRSHWYGLAALVIASVVVWLPPWGSIPLGAYAAVALGLFGGIACIPFVVAMVVRTPDRLRGMASLARSRLACTPNMLAVGLAGVVASFSLVVAMHVMIYSFRYSLDDWLNQVLPAPLYLGLGETGWAEFPQEFQHAVAKHAATGQAEFWGNQPLVIDPLRPAVELIARPIDLQAASQRLPMTGPQADQARAGTLPVWVSEPMTDLYLLAPGNTITLQLDEGRAIEATVMGVWRDYTRQHGAVVLPKELLASRFGIRFSDTQGALWPAEGQALPGLRTTVEQLAQQHGAQGPPRMTEPGEIRQISLDIFDRSFAVTYLLELAAVLIGLFGVATTFSAMAMQRQREFALLRAVGARKSLLYRLIGQEALLAASLAAAWGLLMGLGFAAILVFVVNPQSFHWTMDWRVPWGDLTLMVIGVVGLSCATMVLAMRQGLQKPQLASLKEDWA